MRLSSRSLTTAALATLGSLVVHQVSYLLAAQVFGGRMTSLDHSHLPAQQALVMPVAVLACAVFIVRKVRSLGLMADVNASVLLALLVTLFVGQEGLEFALQGHHPGEAFTHPPVPIGILLAPLVVRGFLFTLRRAEEILRVLLVPRRVLPTAVRRVSVPMPALVGQIVWQLAPNRGPPLLLVTSPPAP